MPILGFTFRYTPQNNIFYPFLSTKFKYNNRKTATIDGILDTGADYILINRGIANYLGVPLGNWIGGGRAAVSTFNYCIKKMDFIIGRGGREQELQDVEIRITDNVTEPLLPLIGRYPLFEFYNIEFDNVNNRFKLIPK